MASITLPTHASTSGQLRPLNILRDLPKVADLIELCFANNIDSEGQSYLQQMRHASRDDSFMRWASNAVDSASMPLAGFIWEQDGRIVGNASLVSFRHKGQRIYLIANVATHPDYRRQGIARLLTKQAMQRAYQRGVHELWLHVREDNSGAIRLYTDLGFVERARRTTWRSIKDVSLPGASDQFTITKRTARLWPQQLTWLAQLHPEELSWYRSRNWNNLKPGLRNWLYRAFVEFDLRQWAILKNGRLQAVLAWVPAYRNDWLWLACSPGSDPDSVSAVLQYVRHETGQRRTLTLEVPAGLHEQAITAAGFRVARTLVWMKASGATL